MIIIQHSTITALTQITYQINKIYDQNKIIATFSTDITAAFNTVDSDILLQKQEYNKAREEELH